MKQHLFLKSVVNKWQLHGLTLLLALFSLTSKSHAQGNNNPNYNITTYLNSPSNGLIPFESVSIGTYLGKVKFYGVVLDSYINWTGTRWEMGYDFQGGDQIVDYIGWISYANYGDRPSGNGSDWTTVNGYPIASMSGTGVLFEPQYTAIPDANFEQALFDLGIDAINGDHQVLSSVISEVTDLQIYSRQISNLSGIKDFVNLRTLHFGGNQVTNLDLSGMSHIQNLYANSNQLTSINLSGLTSLSYFNCSSNQLTELNLQGLTQLSTFNCSYNQITSLDFSGIAGLGSIDCNFNQLSSLDVHGMLYLGGLSCAYNPISQLNVSGLTALTFLGFEHTSISQLDASGLTLLNYLYVADNQLTSLNLSNCPSLFYMYCNNNPNLTCIAVSDVSAASANTYWNKDATANYSINCDPVLAPTAVAQTFCAGVKVSELVATGSNLQWFAAATGGSALASNVTLATGTYYVSQTVGGSESDRTAVSVTLNTPVTTTFTQVSPICIGATLADLPTTSNEGIAGTWSPALNNQATTTYTFTPNAGVCATTANMTITVNATPALAAQSYFVARGFQLSTISGYGTSYKVFASANAVTILPASTILTSGTYYATQTQNGCESPRSMLTIQTYPLTALYSPACNSRLNTMADAISCSIVANATNYLFEVTGNGSTRTIYTSTNSFNLTQLQGTNAYNTAYSIRVAAGFNGQYGDFGSACSFTTPALANFTQVTASMCGTTLAALTTPLYCNQIAGAQAYRFEFTTGGVSKTIDSATNSVQINNLTGGAAYGTAYSVRVAAQVGGSWQSYGTSCTVTTPAASSQIRTNQCNTTLANRWSILYCSAVTGVTAYRFEWSNGGSTLTYTSSLSNMQLGNYTGWAVSTTYSVRVAVQFGGTWQAYGSACNVKTPATLAREISENETALTVKAVPNPFETEYVLMAQGGNQTPVQVSVYDMLGKQVEQFSVEASDLENRSLGTNYTSGIYNVMISQGDDQQVVRIIKK
ncbi:MAG: hypothetical protein CFE24_13525 [Flavobacterium sp. BFFFF2]|nr:MAG: hypothetical protein CFE24_13525 [Flavobacterium sp. BFFFF2]